MLSLVDTHTFKRLDYQVLEHDARQADVLAFSQRFQVRLTARNLTVGAITTDGSSLYPAAIREVFGDVPHQICQFHILMDLSRAVLHAVARVRNTLASTKPKRQRGRSAKHERSVVRQAQRLQASITDLFTHRYLFVQHRLNSSEWATLQRITRGVPQLRVLRAIMEQVYQLFDWRGRTETALAKLARLWQRIQRFTQVGKTLQPLFSTNVDKALTFLDDRALPATSNAVARGNRRHREMPKTIYRVRTQAHVRARIALDLLRDARAPTRFSTVPAVHGARAAP